MTMVAPYPPTDSEFIESSTARDLERRVTVFLASLQAPIRLAGWDLGGAGFGPNFEVVIESSDVDIQGSLDPALSRFFFYSGATRFALKRERAQANARIAEFIASIPDAEGALIVDSQLAGGSQGLPIMGMLVVRAIIPEEPQ